MAEYIDRVKLLDELGESASHHAESGREYQLLLRDRNIVREQPTADVIERSKIDKAIEEMENEVKFWDCPVNYQEPLEVQRNKQAKANSYRHALEILKRNIGE